MYGMLVVTGNLEVLTFVDEYTASLLTLANSLIVECQLHHLHCRCRWIDAKAAGLVNSHGSAQSRS